jgi:hypothetical protein
MSRQVRRALPFGWRLAAIFLLAILLGAPPEPIVSVGPQQTVTTINPKMGVHTRLTDEVEPWKIKRTLQMVREMGAPWIVEYFPWAYYEPTKGHFDWTHADLVVDHARAQGLTVIGRIGYVPKWARPRDTTVAYLDEEHYPDFADFVYAFVEHFKGRVGYIIIWNEPNVSLDWGYRPVDPASYTRLLKAAYKRAKEADPGVQVLGGALAPTLSTEGSLWGMDDLIYLQRMYEAGARDYFDILAVHAYGWKWPAEMMPDPQEVNFRRVELLRQVMVHNGDVAKKIIITEGGWNDHPRWTKAVHPGQRIIYTIQAYEMVRQWDWCLAFIPWAFRYPWPAHTYQDYFTFVTPEFVPKPIYLEVQKYARGEITVEEVLGESPGKRAR